MSWGPEDPLHVEEEPTCPTCQQPMSNDYLATAPEWYCPGCRDEETDLVEVNL